MRTHKEPLSRRIIAALVIFCLSMAASGGDLRFSGVLGQSQPPGAEPLQSAGMRAAVFDSDGFLWSFSEGAQLRCFTLKDGAWILKRSVKPPCPMGIGILQKMGSDLVYAGNDGKIYSFSPATDVFECLASLPKDGVAFHAIEGSSKFKFIALSGRSVLVLPKGKPDAWTELFKAPEPKDGRLYSICVDPLDGEILIGSSYPDMKIRRYAWNGKEIISSIWPRKIIHSENLAVVGGFAWALSNRAIPVSKDLFQVGNEGTRKCDGLANAPDGSWWISNAQGITGFDSKMRPLNKRIGGLGEASLLSASPDGTLIVYDHGRILKMKIDDACDSPLQCHPNETFRVGGNWKSHGQAFQFDGSKFIVLDDVQSRLWVFDPGNIERLEQTWMPLTPENSFNKPNAMAFGGYMLFVSCQDGVMMRKYPGEGKFQKTGIIAKDAISANSADTLFIAADDRICAYAKKPSEAFEKIWTSKSQFMDIAGIAAGDSFLAVAEGIMGKVSILSVKDGSLYASLAGTDVPGGRMEPVSVCILEPWVFIYDALGKRIIRMRIEDNPVNADQKKE